MNRIRKNGYEFSIVDQNWGNFWVCVEDGRWEPHTFDIMDRFISPDVDVMDVGAWIGPTTLYASKFCKRCFSFEPDPVAFEQLNENIQANNITNVKTYPVAIMNYDGWVNLGCCTNMGDSGTSIKFTKNEIRVPCLRLKTFFQSHPDIKFVKIDVEGAEEVIFTDIEFFKMYKPTIYFSFHSHLVSDREQALKTINEIASLYTHRYDENMNRVDTLVSDGVITNV